MARFIHIADSKGRDANVLFSNKTGKSKITYFTPDGLETKSIRVLKCSINQSYGKLIRVAGDDNGLAQMLIEGDPEIDLIQTGKIVKGSSKVFIDNDLRPCVTVNVTEKRFNSSGELLEERTPKESIGNVLTDFPIKPSGKLFPKTEVFNRLVFSKKYQLSHVNGLTFDFLYEWAKELDEKKSLMLIGSGDNGMGPLVFQDGGKSYRAFLEGRVKDDSYILLLHLSNLELKSIINK
jgi:hypothetical protein